MYQRILFIGFALMVSACGLGVTHINMLEIKPPKDKSNLDAALTGLSCQLSVASIEDQRLNTQYLAKRKHITVVGENFMPWINQRFLVLNSPKKTKQEKLNLDIKIKKTYLKLLPSSLSTTTIFNVQFSSDSTNYSQIYRGNSTDANWSFSQKEIMDSFNKSVSTVLTQILLDAQKTCSSNLVLSEN